MFIFKFKLGLFIFIFQLIIYPKQTLCETHGICDNHVELSTLILVLLVILDSLI
jgi:hypothetical protein